MLAALWICRRSLRGIGRRPAELFAATFAASACGWFSRACFCAAPERRGCLAQSYRAAAGW